MGLRLRSAIHNFSLLSLTSFVCCFGLSKNQQRRHCWAVWCFYENQREIEKRRRFRRTNKWSTVSGGVKISIILLMSQAPRKVILVCGHPRVISTVSTCFAWFYYIKISLKKCWKNSLRTWKKNAREIMVTIFILQIKKHFRTRRVNAATFKWRLISRKLLIYDAVWILIEY